MGKCQKSPQTSKSIVFFLISCTLSPLCNVFCFLILFTCHFHLPSARYHSQRKLNTTTQLHLSSPQTAPSVLKVSSDFITAPGWPEITLSFTVQQSLDQWGDEDQGGKVSITQLVSGNIPNNNLYQPHEFQDGTKTYTYWSFWKVAYPEKKEHLKEMMGI